MRVFYLLDRLFPRSYVAKFLAVAFLAVCLPLLTVALLFVINPATPRYAFFIDLLIATVAGFGIMGLLLPRLLAPLGVLLAMLEDGSSLPEVDTLSQDASGKLLRRTSEVLSRLRSSEQHYKALFQAIPDGVSCFNRQGEYTEIKLPRYFAYVEPNLIGKTPEELYKPELATLIHNKRQRMWETGEMQSYELERILDGQISYREVSIFPLSENEGAALVRDISEQKQAQQRSQESEARFRSFFEHSPNPCMMLESDGVEVIGSIRINQALSTFLGGVPDNISTMKREEIIAYIESVSHPEDWQQDFLYLNEVLAGVRDGYRMEKRYLHTDGSWRWGDYNCTVLRDKTGNITRILATIQDITARKHAEQQAADALVKLQTSEAMFRAFFEDSSMPCFIAMMPTEVRKGQFLVNQAFQVFLGTPACEQNDMDLAETLAFNAQITQPEDLAIEQPLIEALLRGEQAYYNLEKGYLRPDGSLVWGNLRNHALHDENGNVTMLLGIIQDISEQKQAQVKLQKTLEQLEASEAKFRAFFEGSGSAHSIINMHDLDTPKDDRMLANQAFDRLMADTVFADMPMRTLADIDALNKVLTHPEDLVAENEYSYALMSGQRNSYRLDKRFLKRDGEVIWASVTHSLIRQADGTPNLLLNTVQDITDLKRTQEHLSQTLARLEDALRAKNMLMREIHHRVKNNLQVIASLLNLQSNLLSDAAAKEALSESRKRVIAMAEIHELMHSRDASNYIDFAQYLEELISLMQRSYSLDDIVINLELSPVTLPLDQAIPLALITNELVSNALKYAFPKGSDGHQRPTISIFLQQTDTTVTLCVDDNGVGLSEIESEDDSLGMTIIKSLSNQLDGTLTFADKITHRQLPIASPTLHDTPADETGLQVTLCFPLADLQET